MSKSAFPNLLAVADPFAFPGHIEAHGLTVEIRAHGAVSANRIST